jgi:hypothetical protein
MLASGLSDLLLGGLVSWAWSSIVVWMLGLIVGVYLITSGSALAVMTLA